MLRRSVVVQTSVTGLHRWPGGHPQYLDSSHRHRFTVRAEIEVDHNEREIEIILCQGRILAHFASYPQHAHSAHDIDFGSRSCETIAEELLTFLHRDYSGDRDISVEVLEDGELGGKVTYTKENR